MRTIGLSFPEGRTEIRVGGGLYARLRDQLRRSGLEPPFLIVSQARILAALDAGPVRGFEIATLPHGERAKSLGTVRRLIDRMVSMNLPREATAIALGGGVVGDVTGFAASIYLRGIRVVQVPTTLLAQVDSSVGGKTGVNHPSGKNLIGTFHQPALVLVDPELLSTLPRRDYTSGLYEALKYGIIRDPALFGLFEQRLDGLLERDAGLVEEVVFRCLRIKADIVGQDAREGNVRRILNFGHTIGHGIESALGYRRVRHGEAVGYGMIGVVRLARGLAKISAAEAGRIEAAVQAIGRLPSLAGLAPGDVLAAMAHDKKVRRGTLHFVIPRRIGDVSIEANVPVPAIRKAIRSLL